MALKFKKICSLREHQLTINNILAQSVITRLVENSFSTFVLCCFLELKTIK